MRDAFFAGRVFVLGERDGFRFFLWGETLPRAKADAMTFTSSFAEPADGAFLCALKTGWLFVAGAGKHNNFRHTFFDDSHEASDNAQAMQTLGIPLLSLDEANQRVRTEGVALYSITDNEKQRADALKNAF